MKLGDINASIRKLTPDQMAARALVVDEMQVIRDEMQPIYDELKEAMSVVSEIRERIAVKQAELVPLTAKRAAI